MGDVISFLARHRSLLRSVSLNRAIHDSAVIQAQLPTGEIVRRIREMIGSRRHNAFVTERETLTDILVHSQDIAVPLGLDLEMPTEAAAQVATRFWGIRGTWLGSVNRKLPLEGCRLTATDTDWSVGEGIDTQGPIGALLLLLTGRTARLDELSGPGAERLRDRLRTARPA